MTYNSLFMRQHIVAKNDQAGNTRGLGLGSPPNILTARVLPPISWAGAHGGVKSHTYFFSALRCGHKTPTSYAGPSSQGLVSLHEHITPTLFLPCARRFQCAFMRMHVHTTNPFSCQERAHVPRHHPGRARPPPGNTLRRRLRAGRWRLRER